MNGYMNQKQEHRPQGRQERRYSSFWCILGAGRAGRPNRRTGCRSRNGDIPPLTMNEGDAVATVSPYFARSGRSDHRLSELQDSPEAATVVD